MTVARARVVFRDRPWGRHGGGGPCGALLGGGRARRACVRSLKARSGKQTVYTFVRLFVRFAALRTGRFDLDQFARVVRQQKTAKATERPGVTPTPKRARGELRGARPPQRGVRRRPRSGLRPGGMPEGLPPSCAVQKETTQSAPMRSLSSPHRPRAHRPRAHRPRAHRPRAHRPRALTPRTRAPASSARLLRACPTGTARARTSATVPRRSRSSRRRHATHRPFS
jgi:hypothetical protein